MAEDWENGGFGIYVHWPFCQSLCPYCDFNSHVRRNVDHDRWARALVAEISTAAGRLGRRRVESIYFGGGTPSLMEPATVGSVIGSVADLFDLPADAEITMEANPGSVEAGRFASYAKAGVNRFSLGLQALNDSDLKALGRLHTVTDSLNALDVAKSCTDNVSVDLIYARQNQSLDDWSEELHRVLALGVDHLSLYQLTIEPGTRFGDLYDRGRLKGLPTDVLAADLFHATEEICSAAGFARYEVSNHARPGFESRHNLVYWRYGDYLGVGPGAHGRLTVGGQKLAVANVRLPEDWLEKVETCGWSGDEEIVSPDEQFAEYALMSLRIREGIDLNRMSKLGQMTLNTRKIEEYIARGLVEDNGRYLNVTPKGTVYLNSIIHNII
jgi:putative oxygen-independent coproporphyrinogen III oxidase